MIFISNSLFSLWTDTPVFLSSNWQVWRSRLAPSQSHHQLTVVDRHTNRPSLCHVRHSVTTTASAATAAAAPLSVPTSKPISIQLCQFIKNTQCNLRSSLFSMFPRFSLSTHHRHHHHQQPVIEESRSLNLHSHYHRVERHRTSIATRFPQRSSICWGRRRIGASNQRRPRGGDGMNRRKSMSLRWIIVEEREREREGKKRHIALPLPRTVSCLPIFWLLSPSN